VTTVGPVTYLNFTAGEPNSMDGRMERIVQARLVVPNDQFQAMGRALLAGRVEDERPLDPFG
jgi:hypothetical protein